MFLIQRGACGGFLIMPQIQIKDSYVNGMTSKSIAIARYVEQKRCSAPAYPAQLMPVRNPLIAPALARLGLDPMRISNMHN